MHTLGNIIAFIFNKIFALILIASVLIFIPVIAVSSLVTNGETVKTILSESDVYNTVPDNILDIVVLEDEDEDEDEQLQQEEQGLNSSEALAQNNSDKQDFSGEQGQESRTEEKKPLRQVLEENEIIDSDKLITTVKSAIGVDFLQAQVEGLVDAGYGFLDGTEEELVFSVSLKERSEIAATEFKQFANESLASLEPCSINDIVDEELNILEATCLPAGSSVETEISELIDELTAEDGIFGETFTQEDLDLPTHNLSLARFGYGLLTKFSLLAWLLILGLVTVVVMTAKTIHRGFKESGIILAVTGAILLLASLVLKNVIDITEIIKTEGNSASQQEAINNIAKPLADNIINNVTGSIIMLGLIIVVLGVLCYALGLYLTKHNLEHLNWPFHIKRKVKDSMTLDEIETKAKQDKLKANKDASKVDAKKASDKSGATVKSKNKVKP